MLTSKGANMVAAFIITRNNISLDRSIAREGTASKAAHGSPGEDVSDLEDTRSK